jgi:hypothetical protein
MKKAAFIMVMALLGLYGHAQSWSFGGEIYFNYNKWDATEASEDTNEFYVGISVGRYFFKTLSVGIKGAVDFLDTGNILSFGPFVQYDFLKYDLFSFGIMGTGMYSRYNESYTWNEYFTALDANRIALNASLLFNFTPNANIELYMSLFSISYRHYWLTLPDYDLNCTVDDFTISSPINTVTLGIKFKI